MKYLLYFPFTQGVLVINFKTFESPRYKMVNLTGIIHM